jgi:4-alpha-glucanotransferase
MTAPLRFCIGLHLHQPIGNVEHVFADHLRDVYRPLLTSLMEGEAFPVAMHLSGPLLEWLDANAPDFVDVIGHHASEGRLELLSAGHDEPILAVLPRADRLEQIARHRAWLHRRFGVDARGLWLTERVWEPHLAEDLAEAGIRFVVVDDRHFIATGIRHEALHTHWVTESGGKRLGVFPIDEKLRYLIPFRPPEELATYLRSLRVAGHPLAILADDGEKFGGWPGTKQWVYGDGWMDGFLGTLRMLRDLGEVHLSRFDDAMAAVTAGGLAYLPSASYREMEGWSLPPDPARALLRLERDWGEERLAGIEGGLLRGGHWRHFLVKYPESNRLHKLMLALSALCRERGDPVEVRRAIGRAQCNDAYWHGVFGGLYLPFLRAALWEQLALAESLLRAEEGLALEALDFDADGRHELWLHSARWSVLLAPARGGAIEFLLDLTRHENLVNIMTRHREAYHEPLDASPEAATAEAHPTDGDGGAPSIHDLEGALQERPATDLEPRALFVDRLVHATTQVEHFISGTVPVLQSWARTAMTEQWQRGSEYIDVQLTGDGLRKAIRLDADGTVTVHWEWPAVEDGWFTTELSASAPLAIEAPGAARWEYPIETVAKSERGFDRTSQGTATVLRWPAITGNATVVVRRAVDS